MKRTTVMMPADLKARAQRAARERGISFGELLRRSLRDAVDAPARDYGDPVFTDSVVFDGPAPEDLADQHDGYLYGAKE